MESFGSVHKDVQRGMFATHVNSLRSRGVLAPAVAYLDDPAGSATKVFRDTLPFAALTPMNFDGVAGVEDDLPGDAFDTLAQSGRQFDAIWMDLTCTHHMITTERLHACVSALRDSPDTLLQLTLSCRGDRDEEVRTEMVHRFHLLGCSTHTWAATPGRDITGGSRTPVRMVTIFASSPASALGAARNDPSALGRRVLLPWKTVAPFFCKTRYDPNSYLRCDYLDSDYFVARTVRGKDSAVGVELHQLCDKWQPAARVYVAEAEVERIARMYKNWAIGNDVNSLCLESARHARIGHILTGGATGPRDPRAERRTVRKEKRNAKLAKLAKLAKPAWKRELPPHGLRPRPAVF